MQQVSFYGKEKIKEKYLNKASKSQKIVRAWLETVGAIVAEVNHPSTNGIDLTAIKNNKSYTFEVKTAIFSARTWKINPVNTSGKKCDFIAIVLPDNHVIFEPMQNHLLQCNNNGIRTITNSVNFHNWLTEGLTLQENE